jgi:adenylate cyclase class 2
VSSSGSHRETEIKIAVADRRALLRRLKDLGFVPLHRRAFEDNVLFDTSDRSLRRVRSVLRLRRYGRDWRVTYKGTPEADPEYKSRLEVETGVDDPTAVEAVFRAVGLVPVFRYQKYRTQFALAKDRERERPSIEVALDETPIGDFIEIEGSRRGIDRVARDLGYRRQDYSTASYGSLYLEDCIRRNVPATNMVFRTVRRGRRATSGKHPAGGSR